MKTFMLILKVIMASGCAHQIHGTEAELTSKASESLPVVFRASIDEQLSTDRFLVVQMHFQNNQEEWMRVREVEIVPSSEEEARGVHIILGQDLKAWARGTEERIAIESHKFHAVTAAILVAAMAAAVLTAKNGDLNASKNLLYVGLGASAVGSGKQLYDRVRALNRGGMIPENHILASFSVPPGMISRHWVVLEKPPKMELKNLSLKLTSLEGEATSYKVAL